MERTATCAGALLLLSTGLASAGALDRTGQPVGILFEEGSYAELSYSFTRPDVQGTFAGVAASGDVGADYGIASLSFKSDLTDRLSLALVFEEPFGANVDYRDADPTYPIAGSLAEFETQGMTALLRYQFNDRLSVHGGARYVRVNADLYVQAFDPALGALTFYDADFEADSDVGYVVGAAYEREEIGLRVALTYSSETSFSHRTSYEAGLIGGPAGPGVGVTEYTLPQSVNLDFRTGIAADTALFGSIRWADWSETEINVPGYTDNPVVSYSDDVVTYTLGIGRRFTDRLSASAAVIYEASKGSDFDPATGMGGVANLSPTSGQLGVQLGATQRLTDNLELSGGIRYTRLGEATTRVIGAKFEDNDALSLGLRLGVRF